MDQNILTQYADVFIPIGVSIVSAIITFLIYKEKVRRLETDVTEIKTETKQIRDKVISCETSLKEREPLGRRKSPVSLTERGEKVLTESGGKKFVDDNYPELKEKVENKNSATSYDIQESAREVIQTLKEDERMNQIKEYLFKEGLEIEDLEFVLGIYLRDKILKDKDLKMEDIDNYSK